MGEQSWLSRPLKAGVRLIEYLVRKSMHVYEFTDDPDCILRIQLTTSPRSVDFETWQISKGETIISIHAWNEKMPKIPEEGATIEWAIQLRHQVVHSFQMVAEELQKGG